MGNVKFLYAAVLSILAVSCNNRPADIPFPVNGNAYPQPVTKPLHLSAPRKLLWVTTRSARITPIVRKLDVDALPPSPFDTGDYRPFAKAPEVIPFHFDSLPGRAFSLGSLPSKPIGFKTLALPIPTVTKALSPSIKSGTGLSVLDIGAGQGVRGATIWGLFRDKNGFLWIATEVGLFRFDGEYTQAYMSGKMFQGITAMVQDDQERIWYINADGIGRIDLTHGTVDYSTAIASNSLSKILKDDQGRIWISFLANEGLAIIDPGRETMKSLDTLTGLHGANPYGLCEDDDKNIWIGGDKGLTIVNVEKGRIRYLHDVAGYGEHTLRAITKDKMGRVWVAVYERGVVSVDIRHSTITRYGGPQGTTPRIVLDELIDDQGRLWMGTSSDNLLVLDPAKGQFKYIRKEDGLGSAAVICLFADEHHRIWAGTILGLQVFEDEGNVVYPVGKLPVNSLYEDKLGRIWVGTQNGIQILDPAKREVRYLKNQWSGNSNIIQNIAEVNGNIWVTTNGGFDIIDLVHKTIRHLGKQEGLSSDSVYTAMKDNKGDIWFTGATEGIDRLDSAKNILTHTGVPEGLSDDNIIDTKVDSRGMIWLATQGRGVDIIDPTQGTIQLLNQEPGLKDTCSRILFPDKQGRMWIGSDKGIYVVDTRKGTMTTLTTREGLSDNYINSFIPYKDWMVACTYNKINLITAPSVDSSGWQTSLMAGSEGLIKAYTSEETNIITRRGQYIWSDYGMVIINRIEAEKDLEQTQIAGLDIFTRPVNFTTASTTGLTWDSITSPYHLPVNLRIPYNQNYLQFQFSRQGLLKTDTTWYCYILQGVDKSWSEVTSNAVSENYWHLSPGNYTLKVSSKKGNGLWGKPTSFSFEIMPPWWQTWWAYVLYVLIFGSVVWVFSIFRSRTLTRQNKVLEEKVDLRTKALNQSLSDLQSAQAQLIQAEKMASLGELTAGIAHEIQNPLNFVNNFSEINTDLIDEMTEELKAGHTEEALTLAQDIRENEEKINAHGKRADAIVKGMLLHSRTSSGTKELTDVNALADEYLRLSYHGLRAKEKTFNATMLTDFDPSLGPIALIPQDMGRVLLNMFTNAFYSVSEKRKTASASYEPTVAVRTKKIGATVEIRIRDNGLGVPKKNIDKIFQPFFTTKAAGVGTGLGLSLSYDIVVKEHGGTLTIDTKEGEYAEFLITLPA